MILVIVPALVPALPMAGMKQYVLHVMIQILIWAFIGGAWSLMGRFGLVSLGLPGGWYQDQEALSDLLMFLIGLVFAVSMAAVAAEGAGTIVTYHYAGGMKKPIPEELRRRIAELEATGRS